MRFSEFFVSHLPVRFLVWWNAQFVKTFQFRHVGPNWGIKAKSVGSSLLLARLFSPQKKDLWIIQRSFKAHSHRMKSAAKPTIFLDVCRFFYDYFCLLFNLFRFSSYFRLVWIWLIVFFKEKKKLWAMLIFTNTACNNCMLSFIFFGFTNIRVFFYFVLDWLN